ncbi:hypothetical protein CMO83_01770 [Candidatus Woesearchaeota archaeon]|jgi:hypothetical protein|nr:hypothetical protein [Candidatus Woesearchaeota archaeon]MDP6648122.1 hypothetical protein [Candidatus Woesearchaeota archaeon]|tara:strand:- start:77690 stop:78061 length:372 start_codon:yes stop_codon:yes gene_type:complete
MKQYLYIIFIIILILVIGCGKEEVESEEITGEVVAEETQDETVEAEIEPEEEILTVKLCHDTDNGTIKWVNGTVLGFTNKSERFELKDFCVDKNHVSEYYCEDEEPKNEYFLCKSGCVDGHCT